MGTYYTHGASRQDIVKELIEEQPRHKAVDWSNSEQKIVELDYDVQSKTVAHCCKGNVLYAVHEVTRFYSDRTETKRFIGVCLLRRSSEGWGYKPMDEGMGPYNYSCPLSYLEMVPEVACEEWRAKVREYHKQHSRKLEVGKTYTLLHCQIPTITISTLKPLRGTYNGSIFRVSRKVIGEMVA